MACSMKIGGGPCLTSRPAARVSAARRVAPVSRRAVVVRAAEGGNAFESNWLRSDPLVVVAGFLGWTVPSSIPVGALQGHSLFQLFTTSIGEQLAHFPVGPALSDKFWLYMITWHVGLFVTLLLGQVGVNGRKQGYFK